MTNPNDSATGFAWSQEQQGTSGLTKREYFAAMAMQGLLSNPNTCFVTRDAVIYTDRLIEELNKLQAADALIEELNK